eukprot:749483-Hanusia_phi.AAC.4
MTTKFALNISPCSGVRSKYRLKRSRVGARSVCFCFHDALEQNGIFGRLGATIFFYFVIVRIHTSVRRAWILQVHKPGHVLGGILSEIGKSDTQGGGGADALRVVNEWDKYYSDEELTELEKLVRLSEVESALLTSFTCSPRQGRCAVSQDKRPARQRIFWERLCGMRDLTHVADLRRRAGCRQQDIGKACSEDCAAEGDGDVVIVIVVVLGDDDDGGGGGGGGDDDDDGHVKTMICSSLLSSAGFSFIDRARSMIGLGGVTRSC